MQLELIKFNFNNVYELNTLDSMLIVIFLEKENSNDKCNLFIVYW